MKIEVEEKGLISCEKRYHFKIKVNGKSIFQTVETTTLPDIKEFVTKIRRADFGTKLTTSEKRLVKLTIERMF